MGNAKRSAAERRNYRRVSDAIALRIEVADAANQADFDPEDLPDYPTHVVSLSPTGLKCYHTEPFNDGDTVRLSIRLFPTQQCFEMTAEVVNAGEDRNRSKNDRFFAGLAFEKVSDEQKEMLLNHIDVVAKQSFGGSVKLVN